MLSYQNQVVSYPVGGHYIERHHQVYGNNNEKLAKKVNQTVNGSSYKLITEPKKFIEPYNRKMKYSSEIATCCSYDLSEIDSPKIIDGKLVFYVYRDSEELPIPFRVTCDNINLPEKGEITRECLPYSTGH